MTIVHHAQAASLTPERLYRLLQLRAQVFVVEQQCAYLDLDGRDLEPSTLVLWAAETSVDDLPLATLRLLQDGPGRRRIGRVCTAGSARGRGLASRLMQAALDLCGGDVVVLDAQSHLAGWYASFGFVIDGAEFVEDGIAHLPMRRARLGQG